VNGTVGIELALAVLMVINATLICQTAWGKYLAWFACGMSVGFGLAAWHSTPRMNDGKRPTVTANADGSVSIDRLDPGESVEIPMMISVEGKVQK
jgi:hypothetical protein